MKAIISFFKLESNRSLLIASIKTSIPLFLNSYLPLVDTRRASLLNSFPVRALATLSKVSLAFFLLEVKLLPLGTKSSSNPFGRTTSTSRSSNSLHSKAVISLTVVKQSTLCAVCRSIECLLCMFNSSAI